MVTIGNRIRRALGMSWKQSNWVAAGDEWHYATWRIDGDPKDAGNWALLTVDPTK